jgi:Flp pilus assembly protein TadB
MDTRLLSAILAGVAVFFGLLALFPGAADDPERSLRDAIRTTLERWRAGAAALLAQARLELSPRTYLALQVAAPVLLALAGWIVSLPLAAVGLAAGLLMPQVYLRYLVSVEARAADGDAPRVLRAMVNRAAAGGTYPDLFAAATEAARHRWVKADFEELLGRYFAREPAVEALSEIRRRQAGRNLRLVFDALIVLAATHQPTSAAAEVLTSLGEAARTNQSIARQAVAESRGLRIQAAILAIVIPALFLYLVAVNPELVAPVTSTAFGQLVLLPVAVILEVAGIVLSWRVTRLEA